MGTCVIGEEGPGVMEAVLYADLPRVLASGCWGHPTACAPVPSPEYLFTSSIICDM